MPSRKFCGGILLSTIERYSVPFSKIFSAYASKFGVRFSSHQILLKTKKTPDGVFFCFGAEGGILLSTIERYTVPFSQIFSVYTSKFGVRFESICMKKRRSEKSLLLFLAQRVGFEPTRPFGQTVFKTASL